MATTRRSSSASTHSSVKAKISHSKNQERAYVAASRRSDRSLDARLRSAQMASDVHEQRTGKKLHIDEQVIIDEEMYDEEDNGLRRSYHAIRLNPNASEEDIDCYLDFLSKTHASLQSDSAWRANRINSKFAQTFPNATAQAQSLMRQYTVDEYTAQQQLLDLVMAPELSPDQDAWMLGTLTTEPSLSPPQYHFSDQAPFGVGEARRHDQSNLQCDGSLVIMPTDNQQVSS